MQLLCRLGFKKNIADLPTAYNKENFLSLSVSKSRIFKKGPAALEPVRGEPVAP
jgi:hypothetical protein